MGGGLKGCLPFSDASIHLFYFLLFKLQSFDWVMITATKLKIFKDLTKMLRFNVDFSQSFSPSDISDKASRFWCSLSSL